MTTPGAKRKLTAILSADVKGYSRLMEDDEEATVATVTTYKEVMTEVIEKHRGRVVDSPGDNLLAEFASVVDAMRGAVEIQEELRARNSELPDHRRMEFRIGINLGDVIEEEGRLYGDGVNIAARVESLAEAGGICVSGSAYDQIRNKLSLGIEYLGEHEVKNISVPVPVYRLLMEPGAVGAQLRRGTGAKKALLGSPKKAIGAIGVVVVLVVGGLLAWNEYQQRAVDSMVAAFEQEAALPLPGQPSIAVLAFENLSGDPEQEYFSDGLSESIITRLARLTDMFVIARNSSFVYKGKPVDVRQVGRELGVRYVLEGSVQKAGERIRITAQLIDAATGKHLWAESYDRDLRDVFAIQDEISRKVMVELQVQLTRGEAALGPNTTDNFEAFDLTLRAGALFRRFEKASNARARQLLEEAVELDPQYGYAIALLGSVNWVDASFGWGKDPATSFRQAEELARRAGDNGLSLLSFIHISKGQFGEAVTAGQRAVELAPGDAEAKATLAMTMIMAGQSEEAVVLYEKALRLAPYPPALFWWGAAVANYRTGRYEVATEYCQKILQREQRGFIADGGRKLVIASYLALGREKEARVEVEKFLAEYPDFSIRKELEIIKKDPQKDWSWLNPYLERLRKAGLPE